MNGTEQPQVNKNPPKRRGVPMGRPKFPSIISSKKLIIWGIFLLTLINSACANNTPPSQPITQTTASPQALSTPIPTATNTPIPSATATPSPTQTPSPTPRPTATAVPAKLSGNPRTIRLTAEPEPKSGASCGLVDIFDFPIAPPDGIGVSRGGGDFGQFRARYDKYHAGEDWGAPGAGSNFGKPVYSIGHGRVMYAQPEGWNRDKGVVILEHIVGKDRQIIYSFYGHLDPPSVVLEPGSCIRRGETVGNIGNPRTPPHLHFEMRTHMPYSPGPGYWEEDPTTAGWLPPSQTIWNQRMASSPGVSWLRSAETGSQSIGLWRKNLFLTIEGDRLVQTNLETGSAQPSPLVSNEIDNGLLHPQTNTLFLQTEENMLMAIADDLLWEIALGGNGRSNLLPLPDGGVMIIRNDEATGLSEDGDVLWRDEVEKRPFAWTFSDDTLIYTLSGANSSAWAVNNAQPPQILSDKTGYPITVGETVWLYAPDGIYRLNSDNSELIYELPAAKLNFSAITALTNGRALALHTDIHDRRLIAFNPDGTLRWNLSVANLPIGTTEFVTTDDQILLFIASNDGNNLRTDLYNVASASGDLTHLFSGGSRPYSINDTWISSANNSQLLINNASGAILTLDPQQAFEAIIAPSPPN